MFGNIMSMFSGGTPAAAPAAAAPAPTPAQPGNLPPTGDNLQGQPGNLNVPAGAPTQAADPQGLDQFKDLWADPQSSNGNAPQPIVNLDPTKLMESVGKMDFSKAIAPEQLQAIAQGGEGAMQAFAAAMNKVAQTVYAQNAMATSKIVEQALSKSKDSFLGELPLHIKQQQVADTLRTENPAFNHPAAAPIMGALQQQLAVKFPNATATELAGLAKSYLENFANAAVGQNPQQTQQSASQPDEMDWSKYLSS